MNYLRIIQHPSMLLSGCTPCQIITATTDSFHFAINSSSVQCIFCQANVDQCLIVITNFQQHQSKQSSKCLLLLSGAMSLGWIERNHLLILNNVILGHTVCPDVISIFVWVRQSGEGYDRAKFNDALSALLHCSVAQC